MQNLKEVVGSGEFFGVGDEYVLFLELEIVPLDQFFLQLHLYLIANIIMDYLE